MQKCIKIELYYIYQRVFTKFLIFAKRSKQQASKYKKTGLCWACGTSKSKVKSMNITSNSNSPGNRTRKLVEEVVPPQSAVGEDSSSAWAD